MLSSRVFVVDYSRTGRAGNHGFAYTFISPTQGKYAGEIIKALELASAPVPHELVELWDSFKKEAEAVSFLPSKFRLNITLDSSVRKVMKI